jgi:hypothetical protein
MQITNVHSLPESIVRAAGRPHPPTKGRISPSALCAPPLVRKLTEEHYAELSQDVSDMITPMLGQGFHLLMEKNKPDNCMNELPLTTEYQGFTIKGIIDQYDPNQRIIRDYKTTSVWAFLDGKAKAEWVKQLNFYKYLAERNGLKVERLIIEMICRDWIKNKRFNDGYPKFPYASIDIPLWDDERIQDEIDKWLYRYETGDACTPDERWERQPTFAVMKAGRKTAMRVLPTEQEAIEWMGKNKGEFTIQARPGANARCESFCSVNKFCPFWKEHNENL